MEKATVKQSLRPWFWLTDTANCTLCPRNTHHSRILKNQLFAAIMSEGAIVLSYDRLLLQIARDEGVEACEPEEFLREAAN